HVVTVGDVGAAIPIQQQPVGTERIVVESWFPFRWRRCQDAQRQIENSRFVDALVWRDERHAPTFESEAGYEQLPAQHLPVQLPLGAQASRTPRAARADQGRHGRHHTARGVGSRTAAPYHLIPIYYSPDYTAANDDFDTTRKATWVAASLLSAPIDGVALVGPGWFTAAQLEQVHAPAYVAAVRTGSPRRLAESSGIRWDPKVWRAVRASNGGAVAAVLAALRTRRNAGSLSSGLHHASRA